MASESSWKFVAWERMNKKGKWCPYSSEVCQLLEQSHKKNLQDVSLSDADGNEVYTVNLKDMLQVSQTTGTKSNIRRHLYDSIDTFCNGFTWEWRDSHDSWHIYDLDVNNFIESTFLQGKQSIPLNKKFHDYNYIIDFSKMLQINKHTKRKRPIRRRQNVSPYPVTQCTADLAANEEDCTNCTPTCPPCETKSVDYSNLAQEVPGTTALEYQVNQYMRNVNSNFAVESSADGCVVSNQASNMGNLNICRNETVDNQGHEGSSGLDSNSSSMVALVNGKPWYNSRPPHTPQSTLKPVPGIDPLPKCDKKPKKKKKGKHFIPAETDSELVLIEYSNEILPSSLNTTEQEDCSICLGSLSDVSLYSDDASVMQLKLCLHMFHKACLLAMYNNGPKDNCLQCPICKKIHGEKHGIQPPGEMIYHVLPYSLPGYSECDTIRIIYDLPPGTQGPEHPNPGKQYTARGFPRHCYLPNNEMGRKVLRLLIKAWRRRLIFTIGRSATTGEENTVTWNEIHHKTEFGGNRRGHGYPDPNYFGNILSELEAQGIKDDEVFHWYPA